ncbi:MAG TPA: OmpA family protein [Chthoniobacter sp.]|jgi:outer membrane protein OmpA-like peptidoglycan-associated protein
MTRYVSFQTDVVEMPAPRRWLWPALAVSLLIHLALVVYFHSKQLEDFGSTEAERLAPPAQAPRMFVLSRFDADDVKPARTEKKVEKPISIPQTVPHAPDDVTWKPRANSVTELSEPIPQDKPQANDLSNLEKLGQNRTASGQAMEKELSDIARSLLDESAKSPTQPSIPLGRDSAGSTEGDSFPNRLTVAAALAKTGGVAPDQPIAMHGGALFEWGKADLRPEAIAQLRELGEWIQRFPHATFVISGHTDHTGTRETNLLLSQQRADAVRDWLVVNLGIDPMRMTTIGKADDEAFPDLGPEKSVEEQALNRRVEIQIKTRGSE